MDRRGFMKIFGALPLIGPLLPKTVEAVSPKTQPDCDPAPYSYGHTIRLDTGIERGSFWDAYTFNTYLAPDGKKDLLIRPFTTIRDDSGRYSGYLDRENVWQDAGYLPEIMRSRLTATINGEIVARNIPYFELSGIPLTINKPSIFAVWMDHIPSGYGVLEIETGVVVSYFS